MADRDEIDVELVFQFVDMLLDYRRDRLLEALSRDERTHENLIKVETAGELLEMAIDLLIPKERQERARERLQTDLLRMAKSTYFRKERK